MFDRHVAFAGASLLLIVVPGCYEDFDRFAKRASRLECKRLKNCDESEYVGTAESCSGFGCARTIRKACQDQTFDEWLALERNDRCTYDPDEAKRCIKALRAGKRDCSADPSEDCGFVFDCS